MKKKNTVIASLLSIALLVSGCASLNNAAKGSMIGAGGGAGLGAAVGALIGKDGKSTAIGATIGAAVGVTAGAIIGKQMDKAAAEAAAIEGAKVESFTDANDLKALKVTFDSGILFEFNKSTLNEVSKMALTNFSKILKENSSMDILIFGHTDNVGSLEANQKVSEERANAVASYLRSNGVPSKQLVEIAGRNFSDPVTSNNTVDGRTQNRRVEIFMYASEKMIKEAEKQVK